MKMSLIIIPITILIIGAFIYRFNGKRELMKMDLVQFIYAFILTPTIIIWLKTFFYFNLIDPLNMYLDNEDRFLIDNILTTLLLFFYAFVVIHSLTKTFNIKKNTDPLFDIFEHSEYFHLWLSHIVTYSSALLIMLFLGIINMVFPLDTFGHTLTPTIGLLIGIILSLLFYVAMKNYKVKEQKKFDRVIKFQVYIYTIIILMSYIVVRPLYSTSHLLFWMSLMFYLSTSVLTQVIIRKRKITL